MRESVVGVQQASVGPATGRGPPLPEIAPALAQMAAFAQRWNLTCPRELRRRCSGSAVGVRQEGPPSCATTDLTGPPVKAVPMHVGDTREPHPVHFLFQARKTRASILTFPNKPWTCGELYGNKRGNQRRAQHASHAPEDITPAPATTPCPRIHNPPSQVERPPHREVTRRHAGFLASSATTFRLGY